VSKLRVNSFALSIDGYGAGPNQDIQNPIGVGALIDELHLAIRPVLLGTGEALWVGIDLPALGYECVTHVAGVRATHVFLRKRV
jgi:hypothetical protein